MAGTLGLQPRVTEARTQGREVAMPGCTTLNENNILSLLVDSVAIFALIGTTKLILAGLPLLLVLDIANEVCSS